MTYQEVLAAARECVGPYCKACPVCTHKRSPQKCQNSTANTAAATPSLSSRSRRIFARGIRSERTKENAHSTREARKANTTANTAVAARLR